MCRYAMRGFCVMGDLIVFVSELQRRSRVDSGLGLSQPRDGLSSYSCLAVEINPSIEQRGSMSCRGISFDTCCVNAVRWAWR